jgi:hypothetical protein
MQIAIDPFEPIAAEGELDAFAELTRRPALASSAQSVPQPGVTVARFAGFDLQDQPLVADMTCLPGQVVPARSVVALRREMVGAQVVLVFEGGDPEQPIILGVIQDHKREVSALSTAPVPAHAQVDDERVVISAEREIVLRCGDASITLTRAGKVIIKGNYIISRSTGYNKIKGAAIDIN